MIDDPFLRALERANPVPHAHDVELPPLGPLPRRRPRTAPVAARRAAAGARDRDRAGAGAVLHAGRQRGPRARVRRRRARDPALARAHRRARRAGVDRRVCGCMCAATGRSTACASCASTASTPGMESVIVQPYGLGDLRDAVTRTRDGADRPIRTGEGIGMAELGFTQVIASAERAARGKLDVGAAREVDFEGRAAYEILHPQGAAAAAGVPRATRCRSRSRSGSTATAAARWRSAGVRAPSAGARPACWPSSTWTTTRATGRCWTSVRGRTRSGRSRRRCRPRARRSARARRSSRRRRR